MLISAKTDNERRCLEGRHEMWREAGGTEAERVTEYWLC